jgi:hypothetical protein
MLHRLIAWYKTRREASLFPERLVRVEVGDAAIRVTSPNAEPCAVAWDELDRVEIETTNAGPFAEDVFWHLITESEHCIVPQGATGEPALLARLQALPGFNHEALVAAMGSAENQVWVCWERAGA